MNIKTLIHGKLYDLTNFKHPGGMIPLYLADNKDATVLYELYHPLSNRKMIDKILSKYEIHEKLDIKEDDSYNYDITKNDLFVMEFKSMCRDYFKNIADNDVKISPLKLVALFDRQLIEVSLGPFGDAD